MRQLEQPGASTVHTSPQTPKTRAAGEQDESTSEFKILSTKKTFQKHQELTRGMYPLLNQALRHEEYTQTANRNCQIQGARACSVQFPNVASSKKQLSIDCGRKRLQDPRTPSRRNCGETIQELTQTMYPLSNQTKPTNIPPSHQRSTLSVEVPPENCIMTTNMQP